MTTQNFNINDLIAAEAAQTTDMNDNLSGGGGGKFPVLDAGQYLGQMIGYTDMGEHEDSFDGKVTGVFPKIRLEFAVFPPREDGTLHADDMVIVRSFDLFIKRGDRAGSTRAFRAFNHANDPKITHFAQFFGKPYLIKVTKRKSKDGKKEYNVVDLAGTQPAINPVTRAAYPVPEVDDKFKTVFLWNNPVKAMWDKLEIEGTTEDGKSRNFIQDEIVNAKNFHGSALELMLKGEGIALPTPQAPVAVPEPKSEAPAAPVAPALPTMPTSPVMPDVADDDIPF